MRSVKEWMFARKSNNAVVIALSVALGGAMTSTWTRPNQAVAVDQQVVTSDQKAALARIEDAFTSIAERVEPTVVTISAKATIRQSQDTRPRQRPPLGRDGLGPSRPQNEDEDGPSGDPFEFFRRNFESPERGPSPAGGSGVIVRAQGNTAYVLTNNHVIRNRDKLSVSLQDGTEYTATLVGADEKSDLAVLKIQTPRPLPAKNVANMGDSSRVRVGQWAIAIGSPLGYDSTFTVGVISAKGRSLNGMGRGGSGYSDLIQTDASINPGNSGGPLVNIDGDVVGINVAIASAPGAMGNIGIGFAIPANTAKDVMQQLIEKGKVTRGWLGVQTAHRELAAELKQFYGVQGGALVEDVVPNSPAAKAGLKTEDVIVRFGDRAINSFTDLEAAVGTARPNSRIQLTIVRDRREMPLAVMLEERKSEEEIARLGRRGQGGADGDAPARPEPMAGKFGLTVQAPTDPSVKGVEVVAVAPGSPAEDAGIRAGDVIQKVGRTEVAGLDAYRRAIDAAPASEAVVLRVRTQAGSTGIRILRP